MNLTGRSTFLFVLITLLSACNSSQSSLAPRPTPTNAVILLPSAGGVASGVVATGAQQAVAIALSGSGDRATFGTQDIFATTTIAVRSSAVPQSIARTNASPATATDLPVRRRIEGHPNDRLALQGLMRRSKTMLGLKTASRHASASTIPSILTVGSTVVGIWVGKTDIGSNVTTNILAPMTLEAQTTHANIWVVNVLLATSSFSGGIASTNARKIGQDFEIAFTSDTTHFASPDYTPTAPVASLSTDSCDATGQKVGTTTPYIDEPADKRTNVMVIDPTITGDGVGGYFTALNFARQDGLNCELPTTVYKSNEAPMIFVLWSEEKGAAFELNSDFITAQAHEFQHLINFVNHGIVTPATLTGIQEDDSFINEGLSVLAQDLAINAAYPSITFDAADGLGLAETYLNAPENFSITGFIGIDPRSTKAAHNCSGCYGGAYLFQRYLRDRCGGDAYTRAIETNAKVGFANLSASCGGENANQLLDDFKIAMAANSARVTTTSGADVFGTLDLNGTYPLPSVPIGGSQAFKLNGVQLVGTSTATVPLGGAAYFALPNPSGSAISIRDTNTAAGFALTGALVQR